MVGTAVTAIPTAPVVKAARPGMVAPRSRVGTGPERGVATAEAEGTEAAGPAAVVEMVEAVGLAAWTQAEREAAANQESQAKKVGARRRIRPARSTSGHCMGRGRPAWAARAVMAATENRRAAAAESGR